MLYFYKLTATHYALRHHSDVNLHIKHIYRISLFSLPSQIRPLLSEKMK